MIEIKAEDGKIVSRSKNLRGIIAYGGKQGVKEYTVTSVFDSDTVEADLWVLFYDGCSATAHFADFNVCLGWCARRRMFKDAACHVN